MTQIEQINKIAVQPSDKAQMQTAKRKLEAKMWKVLSEDERVEYIRLHRQLKDSLPAEIEHPRLRNRESCISEAKREKAFMEYLRGVFEANNGVENDPDLLIALHGQNLFELAQKESADSSDFEAEWKRYTASRKDDMRTNAVTMNVKEVAKHFADWQKKQDDELLAIAHFDGVQSGKEAERKELLEWAKQEQYESTTIVSDDFWQKVIDKLQP